MIKTRLIFFIKIFFLLSIFPAYSKQVWNMASFYPGSLQILGTAGKGLGKKLSLLSEGEIQIRFHEPKALIPPSEIFDAVSQGSVDAGWASSGFWMGKDPTFAMFSSVPFGPQITEYLAWMDHGGGYELMDALYKEHNIKSIPCAVLPPEASGWFRDEIKYVEDFKGLKIRFFGLGAKVIEKLGASTQLIPGGDLYPALELGVVDATEFATPSIDLGLGFYRIAKHYYFPGWHQQATIAEFMMNRKKWDQLSGSKKAMFEYACSQTIRETIAEGEASQGAAIKKLRKKGTIIHQWSPEIMSQLETAWGEVVDELRGENKNFKKVWKSYSQFRAQYKEWRELGYLK